MRLTSKGQVTVPKHIREKLGVRPGSSVEFVERNGEILLVKQPVSSDEKHRRADEMLAWLDSVRGSADGAMTPEDIMDMTRGPFDDVQPD